MVKICPQCNSAYTDESLQFCLSDGTPLVGSNLNSDSWHSAETIYDPNIVIQKNSVHQTSPNSQSLTNSSVQIDSENFQTPKKSNNLLMFAGLAVLLFGTILTSYWMFFREVQTPKNLVQTPPTEKKKPIVQLSNEQQAQINKEITALLEIWNTSNEQRKIDDHIKCYADTLDIYYKESGKDKNHVKADRIRAYDRYDTIDLQIDNLKIMPESETLANAVLDKTWTFKNPKKISTGSVQQQLDFIKKDGKWFIIGEQDLKVYFINNRENGESNTANTNQ